MVQNLSALPSRVHCCSYAVTALVLGALADFPSLYPSHDQANFWRDWKRAPSSAQKPVAGNADHGLIYFYNSLLFLLLFIYLIPRIRGVERKLYC